MKEFICTLCYMTFKCLIPPSILKCPYCGYTGMEEVNTRHTRIVEELPLAQAEEGGAVMDDFSGVKVGDRLWVRVNNYEGWGTVNTVNIGCVYAIDVSYNGETTSFTAYGRYMVEKPQCLFWDKPTIIAPPRPKRMKKVMVEVRPYMPATTTKEFDLIPHPKSVATNVRWCGPIQTIEVEVNE